MTGIKAGGKAVNIVGYGCGDDTAATAIKETRRLMQQLKADVMVGPLSGDEAVAIANWAKPNPTKTIIVGTAGSQDPTMQIAPKNLFRYYGDGAQWNAGVGEIAYKRLGWRNAAIIMDDYAFGWTSAAGMIADFCAVGGKITKRVFPPLNNADYAAFVRQLPAPDDVDGYFWAIGGNTPGSLTAFEQAYGKPNPKQFIGNLFFGFLGNDKVVAPKFVGSYIGGTGTAPGSQQAADGAVPGDHEEVLPGSCRRTISSSRTTSRRRRRCCEGLNKSNGAVGAALQKALPRSIKGPFEVSDGGVLKLDSRRQAIQDQYLLQLVKKADGSVGPQCGCLHPERRPVVRWPVQAVEPAAWTLPAGVQEAEDAVAGEDQGGQERRDHEHGDQVTALSEAPTTAPSAAPTLRLRGVGRRFGGLVAVSGRRSRRRARRASCHSRPERGREDHALQRHRG